MRKLSIGQLKALSGFLNIVAAAWFTGSFITPLFTRPETIINNIILTLVGLSLSAFWVWTSLLVVKGVNS